jgi:ribosomal protein S18 acetylase RimI-like enzyme
MKIEIIETNISNWKKFKSIRLESLRNEPEAFSSSLKEVEKYKDEYWKDMVLDRNNIILLAVVDDLFVGIIRAALKDEDVDEKTAFIGSLYVNFDYRRMGIGKMLINELIAKIKNRSEVSAVRLWVNHKQFSAIQLYLSLGFLEIGEIGKGEDKELIFEKNIL